MAWSDHKHKHTNYKETKVVAGRIIKVYECDCGDETEEDVGKAGGS
jgi:hypothetical protein